jgi:type II secretory pathway component PulJ
MLAAMTNCAGHHERGETLVGLLVGLAVGLMVLAVGAQMLTQQLRSHRQNLQASHLQHDLRSALDWMARELRQAQYTANAWQTRSPSACDDPFCDGMEDFSIEDDWIDFSLDRNHNGLQEDNECMGFRLSDKVLMARRTCSGSGNWVALSDSASLALTALRWQLDCELRQGWLHRSVRITLSGQWPGDASHPIDLVHTVHLRNDLPASAQALYCP